MTFTFSEFQCLSCYYADWCVQYHRGNKYRPDKITSRNLACYCLKENKNVLKMRRNCPNYAPANQTLTGKVKPLGKTHKQAEKEMDQEMAKLKVEGSSKDFLNADNLNPKGKNIYEILEEPEMVESNFGGQRIRLRGKIGKEFKAWTINNTTARDLMKAWGDDSANWKDKKVTVEAVSTMVRGEMRKVLYGKPAS